MTLHITETWIGEGEFWKTLIIRETVSGQGAEGILMDSPMMDAKQIDLSHNATLEDAITEIKRLDGDWYSEIVMYGEEG